MSLEPADKPVSPTKSRISMLLSAVFMGNVGLLVSLLAHYSTYTIALFRGLSGTLFLTLFMIKYRSLSLSFLKETFKHHWKSLIVIGVSNPFIIYLYFESMLLTDWAIAAFLLYLNGIFVMIFLIVSRIEKVAKLTIVSFILAVIGVAIIMMQFWTAQDLSYGTILAILSGLLLGIQVFCMKKIYIKRKENSLNLKSKGNIDIFLAWWPTLFIIFFFLPFGAMELVMFTWLDLLYVIVLGLIPTALAFVLYNVGVKNDKGGNIILLSYFEPVVATINTVIFFPIFPTYTVIGGSIILIANIIVLIFVRKKNGN